MKRIGMGLVGAGFVGPHHVDAVRRLGFVDIVAVAGSSEASGQAKAEALGAPAGYGSYQALLDDPDVQVVHNATPNHLHYAVTSAALAKGKHVVSDKPLAMTAAESKRLVEEARRAGVVTAVTFNYRGNPLVQQARHAIASGDIGTPHFIHGHYLQDWLLKDTDYSWRLDPTKGGDSSALGDIGSHWCDLAQHVTGLRITHVLGDLTTVIKQRKKPRGIARGVPDGRRRRRVRRGGHRGRGSGVGAGAVRERREGRFSVGQVCARTQERSACSRCAASTASMRWRQEHQNELWIGHRDAAQPGAAEGPVAARRRRRAATRTCRAGIRKPWADAFCNLMRDIYGVHCRREAARARCRRRWRRSTTATAPTVSWMRFLRAPRRRRLDKVLTVLVSIPARQS